MSRIAPVVCPILVGRDELLRLAERRLAEVRDGRGGLLLLSGDAGIGKTRMLGAITRHAAVVGFHAATGSVAPADRDVPHAIILDLARAMRRAPQLAPVGQALISRLAHADAPDGAATGHAGRMLVLDLADILAEAAAEPTLLAFEDLQWADDLSLDVLASVARRLVDLPLFIVATLRADQLTPEAAVGGWRARLLTQRLGEEARLTRLSVEETAVMARILLDDRTVDDETVRAIHERTDGIPLHVEELLGTLADGPTTSVDDVRASRVPDTIEATVLERLGHRTPGARQVAAAGAVLGRRFAPATVGRILDRSEEDLTEPVAELVAHAFLEELPRTGEVDFRNQLVRDAIYGAIPAGERRRLHGIVAELVDGGADGSGIQASGHYELAGRTADAFRTAIVEADAAARVSAHREAMELYRRAVRNMPAEMPPAERGRVFEDLGREEATQDATTAAAASLSEAHEAYVDAGDRLSSARVVAILAGVRHLLGDGVAVVGPGLEAELQTLEGLDGPEADRVRARLEAALAAALSRDIARPACLAHAERAVELARRTGDVAIELDALVSMVGIRPFEGDQEETIRLVGEVTRRGREQGLDDEAGRAYRLGGAACSEVFAYDHAERLLRDGIAFAEQHELWNHRCYMTAHLGLVLWATGRWPEADAVAVAALHEARGGVTTRVTGCYVRGYVALSEGRLGDARGLLDESLALGERSGDIIRLSLPLWGLAETALLEGRLEEAIELTERGRAVSARVDDAALLAPFVVTGTRARLASRGVLEAERWVADTGGVVRGSHDSDDPAGRHPRRGPACPRERRNGSRPRDASRCDPRLGRGSSVVGGDLGATGSRRVPPAEPAGQRGRRAAQRCPGSGRRAWIAAAGRARRPAPSRRAWATPVCRAAGHR